MTEIWFTIRKHPEHIVSSEGRIRQRRVNGRVLSGHIDEDGYRRVRIDGIQYRVHRLVCEAFHGTQPEGTEVCHNDGDRTNNASWNLRWGSRSENMRDAVCHGTHVVPRGEDHHSRKLTWEQVSEARRRYKNGESGRSLARVFGITSANMSRLLRGDAWRLQDAPITPIEGSSDDQ